MNVEFINPFLKSLLNFMETMGGVTPEVGKPFLKKQDTSFGDVSGMIGMAGDQTKGSLAITFSKGAIFQIAENMFGEPATELDASISDLVGEITNIVCGGAKAELAEKGYKFALAIPTTITGINHKITHITKGPIIIIPFTLERGGVIIEVCFEK